MRLNDLHTPSLILDRGVLEANITKLIGRCRELGVTPRPHMKTPKSDQVAQLLAESGVDRFTVSTIRELEVLQAAGFSDLFYAVPLEQSKVARVAPLLREAEQISFLIDDLGSARACAEAARVCGVALSFWVEIDVDHYRTGIAPNDPRFLDLVQLLHDHPNTRFLGLMSYGGASYGCATPEEVVALTETHRQALFAARRSILDLGLTCEALSFGSSPALLHADTLDGVTEVRCGICLFQDLFQAGIGAARIEDIAVSVLTTIIGGNAALNRFVIDAGGLALSKDRSTQGHPFDAGFGLVCDAVTGQVLPDLFVPTVSQELGIVTTRSGAPIDFDAFPIGRRLRILPNHADMTAAAYEDYHVVDGDDEVQAIWTRRNGW